MKSLRVHSPPGTNPDLSYEAGDPGSRQAGRYGDDEHPLPQPVHDGPDLAALAGARVPEPGRQRGPQPQSQPPPPWAPGGPHPGHPHHPPNHPHPHPHPHPVYGGPPHPHSAPVHHHHQQHHNPQAVQVCSGCNSKIVDRWFLRCLERNWHNNCLKCTACGATLADIGATCFTKPGMILCKNDYVRLFGQSAACAACSQMIPPSELVMRAGSAGGQGGGPGSGGPGPGAGPSSQVFHVKCFACSKCGLQLVSGDRYYLLGGAVVCEQDWHKFIKGSGISTQAQTTVRKGKVGRPRRSRD